MFRGIRGIRDPVSYSAYRVPRIAYTAYRETAVQHKWVENTIWWERHAKKRAVRGIQVETRQRYAACRFTNCWYTGNKAASKVALAPC